MNRLKDRLKTLTNTLSKPTREHGTLFITRYRALNGTWYRLAFWSDDYKFVHISQAKMMTCSVGHNRNGKKYLKYEGDFEIDENNTIIIC